MQCKSIENNPSIRGAFYARVSSDRQVDAGTIDSQVAALEQRAAADQVKIHAEMRFIDDGESGATLVRPQLERLRDLVSSDGIDRCWPTPPGVEEEMKRRLDRDDDPEENHGKKLKSQIDKVNRGISRLVEGYGEGLLDKNDVEPRIKSAKARLSQLQMELQSQVDQTARARELRGIVDNLQIFSRQVMSGLDQADWEMKRKMIQTLVKKIEIGKDTVNVIYRVDLFPIASSSVRDNFSPL